MLTNVLIISDGFFHPPLIGRYWLKNNLARIQGFKFSHITNMERILGLPLKDFHGLVLYFHHKKVSDQALDAFDSYVSSGGGVLAIHSVTASFKSSNRFTDILGGKFSGHGPVESFRVTPVFSDGGLFNGIPEFQVTDELYLHNLQPDIEAHFTTLHEGQPVPLVWTRNHENGRVLYACPGHRAASMQVPEYQYLLTRGLEWVTS